MPQLADNLAATEIELGPAELDQLDDASRVTLGFPSESGGASLAYGNTFNRTAGTAASCSECFPR